MSKPKRAASRRRCAAAAAFAVEWEPNVIRRYVDGNLYQTRAPSDLPPGTTWVFDHPFFISLNTASCRFDGRRMIEVNTL